MKRILLFCAAALVSAVPQINAGTFMANFDDCITLPCAPPPGSAIYAGPNGGAVIEPTGGVNNSGVLKLTKAINSQEGSIVIEDLDMGAPVNGFDLRFKVRVGGGTATPADGFSFSVAPNLPNGVWSEEGAGAGLSVAFDIYANTPGEAPAIDIKWGGVDNVLRHTNVPISFLRTTNDFVDVHIRLEPDGSLDVSYRGVPVYTDVLLPGFQPTAGSRFGLAARTGGLNENQWVDDIQLTTTTGPLALRFLRNPESVTVRDGGLVTLRSAINDPNLVFPAGYQWSRRGPGQADFTDIPGANDTNYVAGPFTLADSGTQFRVRADGLDGTVQSSTATVTVVSIALPAPTVVYNFNDGAVPAGTAVHGSAAVTFDGGVDNTGVLRLTEALEGQNGAFIINDLNAGQAVDSMTTTFKARVCCGTPTAADGFSFNWANNLPDGTIAGGEEGAGSGLTVAFDIFDNGGGEAPSVDVKFAGTNIASAKVPRDVLENTNFVDVAVQMLANGRVNVVYKDLVLHNNVQIPGWSALGNARFGFGGRTGGLTAAQYIDDIGIATTLFAGSLAITRHPANTSVLVNSNATFSIDVNDPANATFQWQARAPGAPGFTNIAGATSATYTTPATVAADEGTRFRVIATGPLNTVTSSEALLNVVNVSRPGSPDALFNFNDCLAEPCAPPAGTSLHGTARITPTGGIADSGVLHITDAAGDQNGAWVIEDLEGGAALSGFTVAFKAYVDDGTSALPADGYSFSWGTDVPVGLQNPAEEGAGTGLIVAFDLWDSGQGEAPAIDVKWRGQTVAHRNVPLTTLETGNRTFKEVLVNLEPDGTVDVVYGGELIHNNVVLSNFTSVAGARFAFAGRTGGANENQWLDDVAIQTRLYSGPLFFSQEPVDRTVLAGAPATFDGTVNDPARSTFQWQARAPGASTFTNIAGATSSSFTTPTTTLAQNGTEFRLVATGPNNTITSRTVRLNVITIAQPTPTASFNFDDCVTAPCAPPPGTVIRVAGTQPGAGVIEPTGGVGGSGVLKLTVSPQAAGHGASFIVDDLNTGAPVYGMTTSFDARFGGGTSPPADGMSFVWADDLSMEGQFGEDGAGSGLVVTFDIFDNGGGEAPAIDVSYRNVALASTKVPLSFLETGDGFAPATIRVENDGTLDVVYKNQVIYHNLALPGFTNVVGGRFGWGARTGGLSENQWLDNIQIATVTTPAPRLTITRSGNNVVVSWNQGRLQSTSSLNGPNINWTDVQGATSPHTIAPGTTGMQFFRTVSP